MKYYIAYGSNLNVAEMRQRCPDAQILGTGSLQDWSLQCKGAWHRAYLTIAEERGSTVPVVIWQVSEADEAVLDDYEDYPALYYKRDMDVPCRDSETGLASTVTAFVYIMVDAYPLAVPTEEYMDTCREGYARFGFPAEILQEAYQRAWEAAEMQLGQS